MISALMILLSSAYSVAVRSTPPSVATLPMFVVNNRIFIDLEFRRSNGTTRKARTWIDTGGGWFAMGESLGKELALVQTGDPINAGEAFPVRMPDVFAGDLPLDLSSANCYQLIGSNRISTAVSAEAFLPAQVLKHYDVVFDYPRQKFTIAREDALDHRGFGVPCQIFPGSGFPRIELAIGGKNYGFLLDTGAAYTMVSQDLLQSLAASHPSWPQLIGAVGEANMIGRDFDTNALLLRIPNPVLETHNIADFGAVSRRAGIFEQSMSRLMSAPIVGAIAGNLLRRFRVEIDFPNQMAYFEPATPALHDDLDTLGIIFEAKSDGSFLVDGIASKDGQPVLSTVQAGDQLVKVGRLKVSGATRADVVEAMKGTPGQKRRLQLMRSGKLITVDAIVQHLL